MLNLTIYISTSNEISTVVKKAFITYLYCFLAEFLHPILEFTFDSFFLITY